MMTFYLIGCGITLLFSLTYTAWKLAKEDTHGLDILDIPVHMLNVFILSLFYWEVILVKE